MPGVGFIPGKMFDGFEQFGVFLPDDLVELSSSHSGVLQFARRVFPRLRPDAGVCRQ